MKTSIDTAVHFLPAGTPGEVCRAFNRAALATTIAARATAQGGGAVQLTAAEMDALAKVVRDDDTPRPLSPATRAAVDAALRAPLTEHDDPALLADALFTALPDTPLRVTGRDGRDYFLVGVPA